MLKPRDYQAAAYNAVVQSWKKSLAPVLVEAATGAGKSVMIALLARELNELSGGKRVLCLAPSATLVEQNAAKYAAIGEPYSIYSASIEKNLSQQVVFATELTFRRVAKRLGHEFAGVIVDECHRTTPTIMRIIDDMRIGSPNLRVAGFSATPYRLGDGFIFRIDPQGKALPPEVAKDPYYEQCVYSIGPRELLQRGYLTPLRAGTINASQYDTSKLKVQSNGSYSRASVKAAFEGWGRKTASIVADVVAQTQGATGVLIYAATVRHAEEVMASLHPDNARVITGRTSQNDRREIIDDFISQRFTYLVNVGVLTTGFDAPNVSHIAILRATESVSLLQQIFGRGMRLMDGKKECVILDYAGNVERHMPDGDLYKPQIRASYQSIGSTIECRCEKCNRINVFSARKNEGGYSVDVNGYFATLDGHRITVQDNNGTELPMPAHYGRRCQHSHPVSGEQCDYYWSCKECPICGQDNDIAARFCAECKHELVNPNDKLIEIHKEHKKDPTRPQCDELLAIEYSYGISRAGNEMMVADITTSRRKIKVYLLENNQWAANAKLAFAMGTDNFTRIPRTIRYVKRGDFWRVLGFDHPTDDEILKQRLSA